jgi:hypothetical protein
MTSWIKWRNNDCGQCFWAWVNVLLPMTERFETSRWCRMNVPRRQNDVWWTFRDVKMVYDERFETSRWCMMNVPGVKMMYDERFETSKWCMMNVSRRQNDIWWWPVGANNGVCLTREVSKSWFRNELEVWTLIRQQSEVRCPHAEWCWQEKSTESTKIHRNPQQAWASRSATHRAKQGL